MLKTNLKLSKDIKTDDVKIFCKKIDKIIKTLIGHKLITFTVIDNKQKFCERIYSNNNKIYPILGQKKMPKNIWFSLGCGSIINLLVLFKKKPIGTINILHKENHFKQIDLKKIDYLTTYLIPYFLDHQKIMERKIK